jgi:ankyrin repeat protein
MINIDQFINAVEHGDYTVMLTALREQFDINSANPFGFTALHFAAEGDRPDVICWLISRGACLEAIATGETTPLHSAVSAGKIDCVSALLDCGANPNAANCYGITPLMMAAIEEDKSVIDLLLAGGGDPSLRDNAGNDVLMIAEEKSQLEFARHLDAACKQARENKGTTKESG